MTAGKRRSKRTTRKLRTRYPRGVKLHVVESDDGDNSARPTADNTDCNHAANSTNSNPDDTDCNLVANNGDKVDVVLKPSEDKKKERKSYKAISGQRRRWKVPFKMLKTIVFP